MTKKNSIEGYLFSIVGVIAMFVILIAIYIISTMAPARIDVTAGKVNTLSDGTRAILKKLDTPVQIQFFATQGEGAPVELATFIQIAEMPRRPGVGLEPFLVPGGNYSDLRTARTVA